MEQDSFKSNHAVPTAAKWLGGLGALPFVAFAVSSVLLEEQLEAHTLRALAVYGAVILSFLGGVHWGLAIADFGTRLEQSAWRRLVLSVLPSLIGWTALMIPTRPGLLLMAVSFGVMLWVDLTSASRGEMPGWYGKLRWPLSIIVTGCLLVGAVA